MSRSYKKYAVTTCTTSASEKNGKRIAHRVFRKGASITSDGNPSAASISKQWYEEVISNDLIR